MREWEGASQLCGALLFYFPSALGWHHSRLFRRGSRGPQTSALVLLVQRWTDFSWEGLSSKCFRL